jgi:hypothetical protein
MQMDKFQIDKINVSMSDKRFDKISARVRESYPYACYFMDR